MTGRGRERSGQGFDQQGLNLGQTSAPHGTAEHRLKMASGAQVCLPVLRFTAGETRVDLMVFGPLAEREAPLGSINGRPMRRAGLAEVQALLIEPLP